MSSEKTAPGQREGYVFDASGLPQRQHRCFDCPPLANAHGSPERQMTNAQLPHRCHNALHSACAGPWLLARSDNPLRMLQDDILGQMAITEGSSQ